MTDFKIGDKVQVIKSPYDSVKAGTVAIIKSIRFPNPPYSKDWTLYILKTEPTYPFKYYEIKKVE
jgi:hypothetical protein